MGRKRVRGRGSEGRTGVKMSKGETVRVKGGGSKQKVVLEVSEGQRRSQ